MDREQEHMQSLGLFGIFKESFKLIFTWRKIFIKITLLFLLPISIVFFAHIEFSELITKHVLHNVDLLDFVFEGTQNYHKIQPSDWVLFFVFKIFYFTFLYVLYLIATSAVVYTVACVYTVRELSFKKVVHVIPRVWKRVAITSFWVYLAFFLYLASTVLSLFLWAEFLVDTASQTWTFITIIVIDSIALLYMTSIWQLASVVSVLEDSCGYKAMSRSKSLLKGKLWISIVISLLLCGSFIGLYIMFDVLVANGTIKNDVMGILTRIGLGKLCLMLLLLLILLGMVIQTVLYLVCKSYHHENIDKSALSNHLGDYVSLKNVQLQQSHV